MRTWGRAYQLTVIRDGRATIIKNPFRIAFSCDESTESSGNEMRVQIWGLGKNNRVSLVKDEEEKKHVAVELMVGYRDKMPLLFKGSLMMGSFERQGADFINTLVCIDGGADIQYAYTSACVSGKNEALSACMGTYENVKVGAITDQQQLMRPKVLVGNSSLLIKEMIPPEQEFFITDEQAFIVGKKEARKGYAPLVSAKTGLMDVPQSAKNEVEFDTMMNPTINLGGIIKLESIQNPKLNGVYKVVAITTVGESHGESWFQHVKAIRAEGFKQI